MVVANRYFMSIWLAAVLLPGLSDQGSAAAQVRQAKAQATDLEKRLEAAEAVYQRSDFAEAEKLLLAAVAEAEKNGEERNLDLARGLRDLGLVYSAAGKPEEAEAVIRRSMAIRMATLPSDHPDITDCLNLLSLVAKEKRLGTEDPDVAVSLNSLAALYLSQRKPAEAEPLLRRAVAIREKALGPDNPDVAVSLNNLAEFYHTQGRQIEAEPLLKRALAIREKALDPDSPGLAQSLNNLAGLYQSQGRYSEAEPLLTRSLAIYEKALGPNHPDVGQSLNNLAELYRAEGRYAEAEPLYNRALAIILQALGPDHPSVAAIRKSMASLYQSQGKPAEARDLAAYSPTEVARLLGVASGKVVADVGTGDGEWTLHLAQRVGPEGRVFSTDIDSALLVAVREKVTRQGLRNVTLVLGTDKDTGLPANSCDAVLLRLVYHHLTDPASMRTSLRRAVRAGGRLMIIDMKPGNPNVTGDVPADREGHGITPEAVIAELVGAGFELINRVENWEHQGDRFCLVFRRKPGQ